MGPLRETGLHKAGKGAVGFGHVSAKTQKQDSADQTGRRVIKLQRNGWVREGLQRGEFASQPVPEHLHAAGRWHVATHLAPGKMNRKPLDGPPPTLIKALPEQAAPWGMVGRKVGECNCRGAVGEGLGTNVHA